MNSPRLEELKKEFEADGGKWKEFKIGDLFDFLPAPYFGKTKRQLNVSKVKTTEFDLPLICAKKGNNGIMYFGRSNDFKSYKNVLSVIYNGVIAAGLVYAHDENIGIFTDSYLIKSKNNVSFEVNLFFKSVIEKCIYDKYSRELKAVWKRVKENAIFLPVTSNETPDFSYMERYICELERSRLDDLTIYLNDNDLENCNLTQAEQKALTDFKNGKILFKEFKIGNLFNIHPTKAYELTNFYLFKEYGKTPVISNSSLNNGVIGYSNLSPTEKGNIITYSDTTTSDGIFYQPTDFIGYPHVQGLYPLHSDKWSEKSLLYFVALFKKTAAGRFDYANKFNRKTASTLIVTLPVTDSNEIDFHFMETFITAQQKIAIRNLLLWLQRQKG